MVRRINVFYTFLFFLAPLNGLYTGIALINRFDLTAPTYKRPAISMYITDILYLYSAYSSRGLGVVRRAKEISAAKHESLHKIFNVRTLFGSFFDSNGAFETKKKKCKQMSYKNDKTTLKVQTIKIIRCVNQLLYIVIYLSENNDQLWSGRKWELLFYLKSGFY